MKKIFRDLGKLSFSLALLLGAVSSLSFVNKSAIKADAKVGDNFSIGTNDYEIVYETGFESATTGTSYTSAVTFDSTACDGISWKVLGNVSATSKISGEKSMHMRAYKSDNTALGYLESTSTISEQINAFKFNYASSSRYLKFDVKYSASGVEETTIENVTTGATTTLVYEHEFPTALSDFKLKIVITEGRPSSTSSTDSYNLRIDDIQFGKAMKTVTELTYSGTPNKTTYLAGDSFDSSGITVTAKFEDGLTEDVTNKVMWTPTRLSMGATEVKGTYAKKEITISGLTVNKGNDNYQLDDTKQFISHTRESVTYYMQENSDSTKQPLAVTSISQATVFTFELVYTDTFKIKTKSNKYLTSIDNNNGIRIQEMSATTEPTLWEIKPGSVTTTGGATIGSFDFKDLNFNRYLTLFINGDTKDFRCYTIPTSDNRKENTDLTKLTPEIEAGNYATYFLSVTNPLCSDMNANNFIALKAKWSELETEYLTLSIEAQNLIKGYDASIGGGDPKSAVERYDHVLRRYGIDETNTNGLKNFIGRIVSPSLISNNLVNENDNTAMFMIVFIAIILTSVTFIGSYLVIRKRKNS